MLLDRHYSDTFISLSAISGINSNSYSQTIEHGKLNINTASAQELMELPGIGEVIANRIIAHRQKFGPFSSVDDLLLIKGIGEARLNKIKDYITIGD